MVNCIVLVPPEPKAILVQMDEVKGRRKPSGAALRLLQIARKHPEALLEA